jgi:hypothetical protein
MSLNSNLGIPDDRAKVILKAFAGKMKPVYESRKLTESTTIEMVQGMPDLTDTERLWLAYHVGGINRLILYGKQTAKQVIINW